VFGVLWKDKIVFGFETLETTEICNDGFESDVGDYIPHHDCTVEVAQSLLEPHLVL